MFGPKVTEFRVFNPVSSKAHYENQTAEVFRRKLTSAESNLATVCNIVENSGEEDKRSTYEIGVRVLFQTRCPQIDQKGLQCAIHHILDLDGYPSDRLNRELDATIQCLSLLCASQQTTETFKDFFYSFNNPSPFQTEQYMRGLKLLPQVKRLQSVPYIVRYISHAPSKVAIINFFNTLEIALTGTERASFLAQIAPMMKDDRIKYLEVLAYVNPKIWQEVHTVTSHRLELWYKMIDILFDNVSEDEQRILLTEIKNLSNEEIDPFCLVAAPLCTSIPIVANRQALFVLFPVLPNLGFAQAFKMIVGSYEPMKKAPMNAVKYFRTLLSRFPEDQKFMVIQYLSNLCSEPFLETTSDTIILLQSLGWYAPNQICRILNVAFRLQQNFKATPCELIVIAELYSSQNGYMPDRSIYPLLQDYIDILNGMDIRGLLYLHSKMKYLNEIQIKEAAKICKTHTQLQPRVEALYSIFQSQKKK